MTVGRELGSFEMRASSVSLESVRGGGLRAHVNYEGRISGEFACEVLATMTVDSPDGGDGDYTICARCFMSDGTVTDATGDGSTRALDGHRWEVAGVGELSTGQHVAVQGLIDLEDRSYHGTMFERQ